MRTACSFHIILLFLVLLSGCKPTKTLERGDHSKLPMSFPGMKDSTNTASIDWRIFFKDQKLIGLIDSSLTYNWDIRSAYQRIEVAQSNILESKGPLRPMVQAGVVASQRKFGLYTMDGAGNITTDIEEGKTVPIHLPDYYPGLQASWELDVWGKLKNKKHAALNRYLASLEAQNLITTTLIAEVASNYFELMALDNELEILDETIILQENAFELVKVQKEVGAVNELAVRQFEAQMLNFKGMRVEILQKTIEIENNINFLLGRYPRPIDRGDLFGDLVEPEVDAGLPVQLLRNRPDIRQAEFELEAAKADVNSARAAFYPTLNVNGSIGFQAYKTSLLFMTPESYVYSLIGSLAGPLVNRAAIRAQFRQANARQLEALYNFHKSVVNGYIEVYNQLTRIVSLNEMYSFKTNEVEALARSIEASDELFRTGRANYLELIVTQQSGLMAKLELVDLRQRQLNAAVNLYKALGGGWR